jgi:hypothetical protein
MPDIFIRWSDKNEIAALMDASVGVCVGCKCPARVPEDVLAVHQTNDVLRAIIVCPTCLPEYEDLMSKAIFGLPEGDE